MAYDELIKRLRESKNEQCYIGCFGICGCCKIDAELEQAADAIEELNLVAESNRRSAEARADTAEKAVEQIPRWIPVTERLPKEGEFVLVYGDLYPNKHDGGVIAVSKRMDWNYWQGFGRERNITHWMPLPESPKEEV